LVAPPALTANAVKALLEYSRGLNIVWGTISSDEDHIVWGTLDEDNIVWGTSAKQSQRS
jgi:hypothetical protein